MARNASTPRSSHMVPKSLTPTASRWTWSSISSSRSSTWKKARFAFSPPAAKVAIISPASYPRAAKAERVVSLPSMARMENSFTASPTLSRFQAVLSAPDWRIWNMASAERPSFANWTEYSLRVSSSSPE